jgi:Pvc16 N-terminal domain
MSNALSIAAVTRTLRSLLDNVAATDFSGLPNDTRPTAQIEVTTLPPDRARLPDASRNRLNLFLYQTELNAAWRNMDIPRRVRPGENGFPPLGLDLFYLITAYAENDSDLIGHVLLGTAMRMLHDHAVFSRAEIRTALSLSELDAQIERVRITPQPLSLDEISKLWTGFQSEYRLSAAYQVAVVLIDSDRALRAALPVLRRGSEDRGAFVVAAPSPSLLKVKEFFDPTLPTRPPYGKPAAELGDVIVLTGAHFGGNDMTARFLHSRLDDPLTRPLEAERTDTEVQVALPSAADAGVPAAWPAGFYTVELEVQRPTPPNWTTNRLPFGLAPTITSLNPTSQGVGAQPFDLTVTCTPQVLAEQRAVLLFGDREVVPSSVVTPADPDADTTLVFPISDAAEGAYVVRVRVDGVDSIPIDFTASPPQFDGGQTVTITP